MIDDGFIGTPIGAAAKIASRGPESWHPDPEFFYQDGGGSVLDMGPYYITALINLLGRVESVCSIARSSFTQRVITCPEKFGKVIDVEVPTHVVGALQFESGAIAQMTASFDTYTDQGGQLEVYGSEGSLIVPDPNFLGEDGVKLLRPKGKSFERVPLLFDSVENCRGIGLSDMARCLEDGQMYRANSMQQVHVVEIMNALNAGSMERTILSSPFVRQRPVIYAPYVKHPL